MYKKIILLSLAVCFLALQSNAQEQWSLEKSIRYAQQNSLTVKQNEINIKAAKLNEKGNKLSRYPNVSGSASGFLQFGQTINPTTNQFESQRISSNRYSVNASVPIYTGGRIVNSIKQSQIDIKVAEADLEAFSNDMALNVASAYLNILLAEEQLENAKKRREQTQAQLDQTDKLIQAGSRPEADRLDILALIARDEQAIITQQNSVELGYLSLKNLLQLEPDYDLVIDKPQVVIPDATPENLQLTDVYSQALQTQPIIKAGEHRLKSAELGVDIARSGKRPTVSLSGSLNSNWSSFENPPFFEREAYFTQLENNFGQNVGIQINIPIYDNGQTKINMENAELNILRTQIANKQDRQQLKTDIQTAIANARATKKTLEAAQRSVEALEISYNNTQKRYKLGAANTFEFTTSQNNLEQAKVDLIVAKYEYLFRLKIVDFYQGKTITLD